jgi:hypothetical protein
LPEEKMRVDEELLLQSCGELWKSKLGLQLERNGKPALPHYERLMSSRIEVEGDWQGAILLQCPESVARHAAVMLLAADADAVHAEEMQEALNEMARAVGEKIKELIPDPARLSEPVSADDPSWMTEMTPLNELDLSCEGRPVRLSLLRL